MTTHPVLEALRAAHAALDTAAVRDEQGQTRGWLPLDGADAGALNEVVRLHAELEGRVAGLRLHAVAAADAGGAADVAAAADTASWAASAGRNRSRRWGGVWLANLLETKYDHTRAGLATGRISEEHAAIIVRAAENVPSGVTTSELAECEEQLVEKATRMAPQNLKRAARRLLEPLSERLADEHEDAMLVQSEGRAEVETWFTLGDNGDGTWSGKFVIPELHGHILKARLEQLSSPRRYTRTKTGGPVEDPTVGNGLNYTEGLGAAFVELLEHLPEHGHARSGITMVVHVDEEKLRAEVGAATIGTGVASGPRISNQECRRLLCEAGIMPMVMGGKSLPLDLGASSRLYTKAQIVALSALHETCAAEGCDRPFAWCEMHHRRPWSFFGPTDLDNAAPLCGYHHRRVHDAHYEHRWLDDGTVQFRHRWRSRWASGTDPWGTAEAAAAA
jgi:hypothetical protein